MAIEQAGVHIVPKPWGSTDLRPWHAYHDTKAPVGEIWFERTDPGAPAPALLLKLIFTNEPLSIQHVDVAIAAASADQHERRVPARARGRVHLRPQAKSFTRPPPAKAAP